MRCHHCGSRVGEQESSCPVCGKATGGGDFPWFDLDEVLADAEGRTPAGPPAAPAIAEAPPAPTVPPPTHRMPLLIGGAVVLAALLGAGGALLLRPAPPPPPASIDVQQRASAPTPPQAPAAPAAPTPFDPAHLTGRINVALQEAGFPGIVAEVDREGVVTLTGSIGSRADKTRLLTTVVRKFKGINGLRDKVRVTGE